MTGTGGEVLPRRTASVVDVLLTSVLRAGPARVLDCGGGSGRYAVPLAVAGAHVTVVDVSVDALSTLHRRAMEAGAGDHVVGVQGDVEDLGGALADAGVAAGFDLVLAHRILEAVDDLPATLTAIVATLVPGGLLSVLVGNPAAAVLARALSGDLTGAEQELAHLDSGSVRGPDLIGALCAERGLVLEQRHGVGVFADLVPGRALDEPGAREALGRLEAACAQRAPFADIASALHLLLRAPAATP